MYNSIQGEITRKGVEQLHLQSGDLEWEISMTQHSLSALPPVGQRAKVYTFLYHKEDVMKLFGFSTIQERALFLDLIKVSGVGPKNAVKFLSGMKHTDFAAALELGDAAKLSKIPGLGLKTAQKIILSLKGRLELESEQDLPGAESSEIVASLAEMGFERKAAEKALLAHVQDADLAGKSPTEREKILFQRALLRLSSQG